MNFYLEALAGAFKTAPSTYNFVEDYIIDQGYGGCACGHAIKHVFIVENHEGDRLPLGSVCIGKYAELDHIQAQVKAHIEKQKKHLEDLKSAELSELISRHEKMSAVICEAIACKVFVERTLYVNRFLPTKISTYKKVETKIKKVREIVEAMVPFMDDLAAQLEEKKEAKRIRLAAIEEQRSKSSWLGEVGERLELTGVVIFQKSYENCYGEPGLITKIKVGDDVVTSFTYSESLSEVKVGDEITFRGTVKKHDDYQGEKATVVNRLMVRELLKKGTL